MLFVNLIGTCSSIGLEKCGPSDFNIGEFWVTKDVTSDLKRALIVDEGRSFDTINDDLAGLPKLDNYKRILKM